MATLAVGVRYNVETNDWQVGINYLYAKSSDVDQALWFSLPYIAASVLRLAAFRKIVDSFRIELRGALAGLKPTTEAGRHNQYRSEKTGFLLRSLFSSESD